MTKLLTLILCLWATGAGASPGGFLATSTGGGGGASISCIGYESDATNCVEGAQQSLSGISFDVAIVRKWTASGAGTALRLHQNTGGAYGSAIVTAVIYVNDELRGTAAITPISNAWATSGDFVAYSGRSLSWFASDIVAYGVSVDYEAAAYNIGRDATSVTNPNYYSTTGYLIDPFDDSTSSSYELMTILEYQP